MSLTIDRAISCPYWLMELRVALERQKKFTATDVMMLTSLVGFKK